MNGNSDTVRRGIFLAAFAAITATSFCFVLRAMVIDEWGIAFALSETQKGELLGAGLWPFSISIVLLSLLIDRVGFKTVFALAAAGHIVGLVTLLLATGYWGLYIGTFIMALANGAVEAAANPLIATVFRHDKPRWLNRLHAGWPSGLVLGGTLAILLGHHVDWHVKIALMAAPVLLYAALLFNRGFPSSERVASGISYREMLAEAGYGSALVVITLVMLEIGRIAALPGVMIACAIGVLTALFGFFARSAGRPLFIVLVLLMIPLATTELSTDSWIASLMEPELSAIGLDPGWVLVYTSLIVFVIRIFAGSIIRLFGPIAVLGGASVLAAIGLYAMAGSTGAALLLAATLYGVGKSFFWGTSLAVTSEQFPRGGAVTLNMVAGSGMLAAGIVGSVLLGAFQDTSTTRALHSYDAAHGTALTRHYVDQRRASIFGSYQALDPARLAAAPPAERQVVEALASGSKKAALANVAILPAIMAFCYGLLLLLFRRRGGYRPVLLEPAAMPASMHP